jgi:hypothetical protein
MPHHPGRKPGPAPERAGPGWDLRQISAQELREMIEHVGITQADAARRMHARTRTVEDWLAGKRRIPLTASETLALSLMWPGESRRLQPTLALVERWLRPQFAGLILSM